MWFLERSNMENIRTVVNLLEAVRATMDTISVVGIENQDKFVGCANAVRTAAKQISDYIASAEKEEVSDG